MAVSSQKRHHTTGSITNQKHNPNTHQPMKQVRGQSSDHNPLQFCEQPTTARFVTKGDCFCTRTTHARGSVSASCIALANRGHVVLLSPAMEIRPSLGNA